MNDKTKDLELTEQLGEVSDVTKGYLRVGMLDSPGFGAPPPNNHRAPPVTDDDELPA